MQYPAPRPPGNNRLLNWLAIFGALHGYGLLLALIVVLWYLAS